MGGRRGACSRQDEICGGQALYVETNILPGNLPYAGLLLQAVHTLAAAVHSPISEPEEHIGRVAVSGIPWEGKCQDALPSMCPEWILFGGFFLLVELL